jgi:type IV fimbrial biogenesis protein FimT
MFEGEQTTQASTRIAAGFTLVELMVVILIAAILLGIAVPAMQSLFAANQLSAMTDTFASAMGEARSEAGKFGVPVALTTTGGQNWGAGWTMFVDTNGNGTLDAGQTPPETTLRTGAAMPGNYTMSSNGASAGAYAGKFWFDATGRLLDNTGAAAAATAQFQFCQGGGPAAGGAARLITVSPSGRVRVAQNDAQGYPLDDSNARTACP